VLRGFKEFFLRGNVVHLTAAVVLGTAFTALVTSVVTNWISPLLAALGGRNPNGLSVTLVRGNFRSVMDFGAILTAVIIFAIIAAVVYYLIILPMKEIQLRRMWATRSKPPARTEVDLLTEISGLLRQQSQLLGVAGIPAAKGANGQTSPTQEHAPLMVEVTQSFSSRLVMLPGNTPGLVIDYGGNEMAFAVGRGMGGVVNAHEFAVNLAYTALAFASRCRIQMSPKQPETAARG
jgi:large conductance mechanosensitive channel